MTLRLPNWNTLTHSHTWTPTSLQADDWNCLPILLLARSLTAAWQLTSALLICWNCLSLCLHSQQASLAAKSASSMKTKTVTWSVGISLVQYRWAMEIFLYLNPNSNKTSTVSNWNDIKNSRIKLIGAQENADVTPSIQSPISVNNLEDKLRAQDFQ